MVGDLDATFLIAVNLGHAGKLAVAGFAAVNADPHVGGDRAIGHQDRAGVNHFQSKRTLVAEDAVVAVDVGFRAVGNGDAHAGVVADHVFRPRGYAVTAVQ